MYSFLQSGQVSLQTPEDENFFQNVSTKLNKRNISQNGNIINIDY